MEMVRFSQYKQRSVFWLILKKFCCPKHSFKLNRSVRDGAMTICQTVRKWFWVKIFGRLEYMDTKRLIRVERSVKRNLIAPFLTFLIRDRSLFTAGVGVEDKMVRKKLTFRLSRGKMLNNDWAR